MFLNRIRWRIGLPFLGLILATMLGVGLYVSSFARQALYSDLQAELVGEARLAADSLAGYFPAGSHPAQTDYENLAHHWSDLIGRRVTIIAADGTVLGESGPHAAPMENHLNRPEIQQALVSGQGSSTRFSETDQVDMLYAAVPIRVQAQVAGYVRVALPLQDLQAQLARLQGALTGAALAATLVAILLSAWIASHTTRPLLELTAAAQRLASGKLDSRLLPASPDEVGQLTQAFNQMAVQLRTQINDLERERSTIAGVLAVMSDGVVIVDSRGRVQLLNPAAEAMFEINRAEALDHSVAEVLRYYQMVDLWRRCQETGEAQSATLEIGARKLYLQGVATPLGKPLPGSILLLFQNLTRLRQLETVRRDFISNISHELRTPLASLKALTETLQDSALDDPPAAHRFLQRMETEVDALIQMVNELLELARIESGRVPLQLKATPPSSLIGQAVERLRMQAERAGLEVVIECAPDLPPVLADPNRLEQVLVNLLHNAIKFTPSGGHIIVRAEPEDGMMRFSVKDTGVGIPAGDLSRIFERFFKGDRARSGGGTGLGLAISRHLVEAHGGRIWAESVEGKGSTFFFIIPQAR